MLDGAVMSIGKIYISICILLSLFAASVFFIQLNQGNEYKQYINYQIERNGGLTPSAMEKLQEYNEKHYDSRFTIESPMMSQKLKYGDEVNYTVKGNFKILYFDLPIQTVSTKGSALSLIR
ncbi:MULTISPECIES: hypothetical protein [Bacillaceae]|uniref:DUF4320 family protein n=1 Tax=Bacillus velezensis TaxID=492670 RepID=A0ABC8DFP5_BACVE|nr:MULTISPECIES: hypothetical protein [Bacillaceae]AVI31077.1 hypothetical protein C3Z10_21605 [Bacillus velezensis]AWX74629.1 hypothetical protein BVDSYZ_21535 [Bacillus velezensis]KDN91404.1 hypothetical protein EF87_18740 [Bacillus amyloliquefaciens]MBR7817964.1 hypothetical protein [Bacillus sp. CCNWLCWHY013]MDJ0479976.1 hypothetical protein [Bacillus amyloliquefaciens]